MASLIGKNGKLISWTFIRVPPAGLESQVSYPVALVKLEDGQTIMAQMVDYLGKNLEFGQNVVTIIRRTMQPESDEVIPYGIKVRPV